MQTIRKAIDFAKGHPADELLPVDLLARAFQQLVKNPSKVRAMLQYGDEFGGMEERQAVAEFVRSQSNLSQVNTENIFLTSGATNGVELITRAYTKPGDTILLERPSYHLMPPIFRECGLNFAYADFVNGQLNLEQVDRECSKPNARVRLFYTIPVFQNPTGVTMNEETRAELCRLARKHKFTIIADEVYQHVYFHNRPPPPPLATCDPEASVFSVGSFSKIFGPGLRCGWVHATNPGMLDPFLKLGVVVSGGGMSPFTSPIVAELIRSGDLVRHVEWCRKQYEERAMSIYNNLLTYLPPGCSVSEPQGGYFLWIKLPEYIDAQKLRKTLSVETDSSPAVHFVHGAAFDVNSPNFCRFSCAHVSRDEIEPGCIRFAESVGELIRNETS